MKVPSPANNSKILNSISSTTRNTASPPIPTIRSLCEPKSVLDLPRSLSPVPITTSAAREACNDPLQLEDHVLINNQLEDWDSLMRELGLHDDCTPVSKPIPHQTQYTVPDLPELPIITSFDSAQFAPADYGHLSDIPINQIPPNSFDDLNWNAGQGFDYVDDLIRLAECMETNSLQLCQVILARLNQSLESPTGKPIQRAAFYFKEAIQSLLTGSTRHPQIIETIKAHKTFSSISPVPLFASFTANQAVLEAVEGSTQVHIIDFDIGLGGQWASFMKELADKAGLRQGAPPVILRISALVPENYAVESRLVRENLTQFARELQNITFHIDFVLMQTFKYLSFKSIKFVDGEKLAILLSPAIFRQVGTGFVNDMRRVSPDVIVHVDAEGQSGSGTSSCRQALIDGLEFYSTLLESLEATNFNGGDDWIRRIETFVLFPKMVEGVEAALGRRGSSWREALTAAGLRQEGLSRFADFQAECLLRRVQVRGFHVVKRQAEMLLYWHDRPLAATSTWRY